MNVVFWDTPKADSTEELEATALEHFANLSSEQTMQAIELLPLHKLLQVSWALAIGRMHALTTVLI